MDWTDLSWRIAVMEHFLQSLSFPFHFGVFRELWTLNDEAHFVWLSFIDVGDESDVSMPLKLWSDFYAVASTKRQSLYYLVERFFAFFNFLEDIEYRYHYRILRRRDSYELRHFCEENDLPNRPLYLYHDTHLYLA